jgi:hypothetical protein
MEKTETFGDAFERLNSQLDSLSGPVASPAPATQIPATAPVPSTSTTITTESSPSKFVFSFNPLYIYGAIPIIILLILMMAQPNFIKEEFEENGEKKRKMNFKKVLLWTAGFSIVLIIGVFAYFYQKNKLKVKF